MDTCTPGVGLDLPPGGGEASLYEGRSSAAENGTIYS